MKKITLLVIAVVAGAFFLMGPASATDSGSDFDTGKVRLHEGTVEVRGQIKCSGDMDIKIELIARSGDKKDQPISTYEKTRDCESGLKRDFVGVDMVHDDGSLATYQVKVTLHPDTDKQEEAWSRFFVRHAKHACYAEMNNTGYVKFVEVKTEKELPFTKLTKTEPNADSCTESSSSPSSSSSSSDTKSESKPTTTVVEKAAPSKTVAVTGSPAYTG